MLGTVVNAFLIIIGSLVGLALGKSFKENWKETLIQGIAIIIILMGIEMALAIEYSTVNLLVMILSMVLGGLSGEILGIERVLEKLGHFVEQKLVCANGDFSKGFVMSSLIYLVGPMAALGALEGGLTGNHQILLAKGMLDGVIAVVFASRYGAGVLFSSVLVFVYQGSIVLGAMLLQGALNQYIVIISAVGGLLMVALGINLLGIIKIRVGNLFPALFFTIPLSMLVELLNRGT